MSDLVDRCGRKRSPATMPGFRKGQKPANFGKRYPQEVLSEEQVLTLIDGQSRTSATGLRNRALIAFMWRSGARVGCEALRLEVGDLNFGASTVHIKKGKGSKARIVAMDPFGWDTLAPWLARRGELPGVDVHSGLVFCTIAKPVTGGPMQSAQVRQMLNKTARDAGITQRVTPHSFRHSLAAGLFDEGMDLRAISKMLGHSNLATTDIYVNHLPSQRLVEAITSRPVPGQVA
jgi:integrase/recombinase XerD